MLTLFSISRLSLRLFCILGKQPEPQWELPVVQCGALAKDDAWEEGRHDGITCAPTGILFSWLAMANCGDELMQGSDLFVVAKYFYRPQHDI